MRMLSSHRPLPSIEILTPISLRRPLKAIREASPQARHHFTQADQVDQLVSASEADPDLGFMARTMALCSLPRTNPGNQLQYKRVNGPYKLAMIAGTDNKTPLWQPAAPVAGLGVHRSSTHLEPCVDSGRLGFGVHA